MYLCTLSSQTLLMPIYYTTKFCNKARLDGEEESLTV
jgi:hypothetical protein